VGCLPGPHVCFQTGHQVRSMRCSWQLPAAEVCGLLLILALHAAPAGVMHSCSSAGAMDACQHAAGGRWVRLPLRIFAIPRSPILTTSWLVTMMLPGLMSRWSTCSKGRPGSVRACIALHAVGCCMWSARPAVAVAVACPLDACQHVLRRGTPSCCCVARAAGGMLCHRWRDACSRACWLQIRWRDACSRACLLQIRW
jgi:hypothetical protein